MDGARRGDAVLERSRRSGEPPRRGPDALEYPRTDQPTDVSHRDAEVVEVVRGDDTVMGPQESSEAVVQAEHEHPPIDRTDVGGTASHDTQRVRGSLAN
jgi:hypothetical protein